MFLLCFSITSPPSFENVSSKWWPEINHHAPEVPFILVGTQADLRDDQTTIDRLQLKGEAAVTALAGSSKAEELGARCYLECSALNQAGLGQVFETAVRCASSVRTEREKGQCLVL